MKMKILFTDLDGTLLNAESLISGETMEFLREFVADGNLLVPASGRPLLSMTRLLESTCLKDLVHYLVAYNGALIWDCADERPAWNVRIPFDAARTIQQACIDRMIHVQTYNHETVYTVTEDMAINYYKKRIFLPVVYTGDPMAMCDEEPLKMLAIDLEDHDRLLRLAEELMPLIGREVSMVFSNPYYLEFFNSKAGKGNAVLELCKLLGVPVSDSIAAGDEENDISMITAAGCGIAMQNATGPVKEAADVVTELDNAHDGLIRYLKMTL